MPDEQVAAVAERQETVAPPKTERHETASETPPVKERPVTSRVNIEDLSHEAYQKYLLTGRLPPVIEPREKAPPTPDELNPLSKLSREEYQKYQETGKLPERLTEQTSEEQTQPDKDESKEPEFVRLGAAAITPEAHEAAVKTYEQRMNKAWKEAGDHPQIIKEAGPVFAKLCGGNKQAANSLLAFMDSASAHMAHPADAMREFIRNAEFRGRIEKSGPDQIIAILSKFDREFQTPKRSRVPAPATSISGKATAPTDEEASASARGDFAAYERAANAADIARSKRR
jgi:hypothetical protein